MPVWPDLSTNNTNALDSVLDKPELAVPMLYDTVVATQAIIAARGVANGVASLGHDGKVPAAEIASISGYLTTALNALGALTPSANKLPYFTSGSVAALADITAYARTLLAAADASTANDVLGTLGIAAKINALIDGAGITPSTADDDQALAAVGVLTRRNNKILNGQFGYRLALPSSVPAGTSGDLYIADQWRMRSVGSTYAVTTIGFTRGQTEVPGDPGQYQSVATTSVAGAGNYCLLSQPMESVFVLAGKTVTVSFWAKAASTATVCVSFRQYFSAGGSSPVDGIGKTKINIGTAWAEYTATMDVDSVAGKTGGNNATTFTDLQLWLDAGSNYNGVTDTLGQASSTVDITNIQVVIGRVSSRVESPVEYSERDILRRYMEVGGSSSSGGGVTGGSILATQTVGASQATYMHQTRFLIVKRATPTITLYNPVSSNNELRNISINADCSASTVAYASSGGFVVSYTTAAGSASGNANAVNWIADSRFTA